MKRNSSFSCRDPRTKITLELMNQELIRSGFLDFMISDSSRGGLATPGAPRARSGLEPSAKASETTRSLLGVSVKGGWLDSLAQVFDLQRRAGEKPAIEELILHFRHSDL